MAYAPKIFTQGDQCAAADLNQIGQGIAKVQSDVDSLAAQALTNVQTALTSKLPLDGSAKMTGTLSVPSGVLNLNGGCAINGNYAQGVNLSAPNGSFLVNGARVLTEATSRRSGAMLSMSGVNSSNNYVYFNSISNYGAGGFSIMPTAGYTETRISSVDAKRVLVIGSILLRPIAGVWPETLYFQIHNGSYSSCPGVYFEVSDVDSNCYVPLSGAIIADMASGPIYIMIWGPGYIDATVTLMTLD